MAMMHLASKKKELEHNIANCPNEALRNRFRHSLSFINNQKMPINIPPNRFRQELQGVQNDIKRLEGGGFS